MRKDLSTKLISLELLIREVETQWVIFGLARTVVEIGHFKKEFKMWKREEIKQWFVENVKASGSLCKKGIISKEMLLADIADLRIGYKNMLAIHGFESEDHFRN